MLYIVSTPIGNLKDITIRAIEVLKQSSYILCEDTRVSKVLLDHYDIKTKLHSFYKFNEKKVEDKVLQDLKNDMIISLISDAGTPLISDPGENLIKKCFENNIKVEAIPGASSVIEALVLSGFETIPFQFLGFLPKDTKNLEFSIKKMLFFDGTSIAFETAKRIETTIELIAKLSPSREVAILKEMTKKFEIRISLKALGLLNYLKTNPLKGEIVIVIRKGEMIDELSLEETIKLLQTYLGLSLNEAIKMCTKIKNVSKKELYKIFKIK